MTAPKIFSVVNAMIMPFMKKATTDQIKLLDRSDQQQTIKVLLDEIDANQLPVHYGGTMTDSDGNPYCITKVNMGGLVPHSYYFNNRPKLNNANKKRLKVPNGSKEQLEFQVKAPGSTLRWEFYSEGGDIGFAIYQSNERKVVSKGRIDCHIVAEEGQISTEPGQYIVEFNNIFSFVRSKIIWYAISVDSI